MTTRPINEIAREIRKYWENVHFSARPYLDAMLSLHGSNEKYGYDDARSIIIYFLSNARSFKGEDAKRIKTELKQIAGIK
jgi:hypothetical protein